MTNGGPSNATELLGIYMTTQAFRANRFGYASAISVIILLIVGLVLIWPALRVARERLEY
jgi:xylobiose transport system permease protein